MSTRFMPDIQSVCSAAKRRVTEERQSKSELFKKEKWLGENRLKGHTPENNPGVWPDLLSFHCNTYIVFEMEHQAVVCVDRHMVDHCIP